MKIQLLKQQFPSKQKQPSLSI